MRLLAKDPDDRPQSAREVAEAIEALERGETEVEVQEETSLPPAPTADEEVRKRERPKRPRIRRKKQRPKVGRDWGPWVLGAGAALLVIAALLLLLVLIRHAR